MGRYCLWERAQSLPVHSTSLSPLGELLFLHMPTRSLCFPYNPVELSCTLCTFFRLVLPFTQVLGSGMGYRLIGSGLQGY